MTTFSYKPNRIQLKSDNKIFGLDLTISGILFSKEVNKLTKSSSEKAPTTCLADFKKEPQLLQITSGSCNKIKRLDSLIDKKILIGKPNISTSLEAKDVIESLSFDNCIKLFKSFELEVDLNKICSEIDIHTSALKPFKVKVEPFMDFFIINGNKIKILDERHILWALCDQDKRFNKRKDCGFNSIKSKNGDYIPFKIDNFCDSDVLKRKELKQALTHWDKSRFSLDTTLPSISLIADYMMIGSGFISINSNTVKNLSNGMKPKIFSYKNAFDICQINQQFINSFSKKPLFISDSLKESIIEGYSESYADKCLDKVFN